MCSQRTLSGRSGCQASGDKPGCTCAGPEVSASSFSGPVPFIHSFIHLQTQLVFVKQLLCVSVGFPGGTSGKEPSYQCRRHKAGELDPWEDPLEEEMATHSTIVTWRIPWTEEPGELRSMGSQRVGDD